MDDSLIICYNSLSTREKEADTVEVQNKTHNITIMYVYSCLRFVISRLMISCAFHGDKRMVHYLPDPSLFLSRRGWDVRLISAMHIPPLELLSNFYQRPMLVTVFESMIEN